MCLHFNKYRHYRHVWVGDELPQHPALYSTLTVRVLPRVLLPHQSDTLTIPIQVLPEPDVPGVYLPQGGLIQTTEDYDLVLEGLAIVERDGFYREREMEGEITTGDLDANPSDVEDEGGVVFGGTWPGEVG